MKNQKWFLNFVWMSLFSSCAPINFVPDVMDSLSEEAPLLIADPDTASLGSFHFPLSKGSVTHTQLDLETNETHIQFQVRNTDGHFINHLDSQNLVIKENNITIPFFSFNSNQHAIKQTADIVFAVDVTGSMGPTIESAKTRLFHFIDTTRAQGYKTRMCIVTFGDSTVKHCNRFYNNDPSDPSTLSEITQLKAEISNLRALSGAQDPGGLDLNENPMRAIIDASNSPFTPEHQRFLILITDDGFLFSPSNQGSVGRQAPFMHEVRDAINRSQLKIFAVTPSLPGYNSNFRVREGLSTTTYPSIVTMSQGEHFLFSDLISGRITLDTILNRIISHILTTYHLSYTADNIPGLLAHLPIIQRSIHLGIAGRPDLEIVMVSKNSSLPQGRSEYPKEWLISDRPIKPESVKVKMNGHTLPLQAFSIFGSKVRFSQAPQARSKIEIEYEYEKLIDSLERQQILLPKEISLDKISVFINGIKATKDHVQFVPTLEESWSLELKSEIFENDIFSIKKSEGAFIQIFKHQ
jgi:hypothetical protein